VTRPTTTVNTRTEEFNGSEDRTRGFSSNARFFLGFFQFHWYFIGKYPKTPHLLHKDLNFFLRRCHNVKFPLNKEVSPESGHTRYK
jgi:hypothetical protein